MANGRNVVLTGFMGTGKTAVGRQVARGLGRRFVDVDVEIEARAGKSVASIFAQEGESEFRRLEASVCAELSWQTDLVIATNRVAKTMVAQCVFDIMCTQRRV